MTTRGRTVTSHKDGPHPGGHGSDKAPPGGRVAESIKNISHQVGQQVSAGWAKFGIIGSKREEQESKSDKESTKQRGEQQQHQRDSRKRDHSQDGRRARHNRSPSQSSRKQQQVYW